MWHDSFLGDNAPKFIKPFNSKKKRKYRTLDHVSFNDKQGIVINVEKDCLLVLVNRFESYRIADSECSTAAINDYILINLASVKVEEKAWSYHFDYLYKLVLFTQFHDKKKYYQLAYGLFEPTGYYYPLLINLNEPEHIELSASDSISAWKNELNPIMECYVDVFKKDTYFGNLPVYDHRKKH